MKMLRKVRALEGNGFEVRTGQPITCENSEPEPDLALVTVAPDGYLSGLPKTAEIVVKISLSSVEIDRRKVATYAAARVREYWIILPATRRIEVYTGLTETGYTVWPTYADGQTAVSEVRPGFTVELAELFPQINAD